MEGSFLTLGLFINSPDLRQRCRKRSMCPFGEGYNPLASLLGKSRYPMPPIFLVERQLSTSLGHSV